MIVRELLKEGTDQLKDNHIDTAYLDCTLLLGKTLHISREKLFASLTDEISPLVISEFKLLLQKRLGGYPVAYLLGTKEFYGLDFFVKEGVLCPRPDSELLVEKVLSLAENDNSIEDILDLCTGTGCLAIAIKKNLWRLNVQASDVSSISEEVFCENNYSLAEKSIIFTKSYLFESIIGEFDIIVSNPPYLTTIETEQRMEEGWKEPELALDGGPEGLDLIDVIIEEAPSYLKEKGHLLIEAHPSQMESMKSRMKYEDFTNIQILKDMAGLERIICGEKG